ncbi:MAG TPA: sigma 54-interacting transcriptional regulator [Pyrinomonadaceae bacterium]|nr:sigma 54-interacting transcriptional regulator [Pyrinomonadaceae bacterium]
MSLAKNLHHQLEDFTLDRPELALARCQVAREMEECGDYEGACEALGEWWQKVGERPDTHNLDEYTRATVLLRAGALTGFLGSTQQIEGAQEFAKDLISESINLFESLNKTDEVAEAQTDLAYCYWREGAYDEARIMLLGALSMLSEESKDGRAIALLRLAIVESASTRNNDALRALNEAAPLFGRMASDARKGNYHMVLAIVLDLLSVGEHREDYADRALVEYTAASFHFEQAGHTRYLARVENNLGFLHFQAARFPQAYEHLGRARQLFSSFHDEGSVAQVEDTRARALLAEGRNEEAEKVIKSSVRTLEDSDEQSLLAEALTTWGTTLARLGRRNEARTVFQRAFDVAERAGDLEGAGVAELATLEELGEHLSIAELRAVYELADHLLARTQHPGILERLRACARRVIAAERTYNIEFDTSGFAYGSEQTALLLREAHSVAHSQGAALLTGETGTGKELLARLMHEWSGRPGQFVAINCATLCETLIESQLFGHVKGSFTDAVADYPGAARLAAGGTLFLDEIAELSAANQSKLLRFIEYGEIHTVGAAAPERVDVRVMAATNRVLEDEIAAGRFRRDLFYRLQNFHLELPPLRARVEDIPVLAEHFIREAMMRQGKRVRFTPDAIEAMCRLPLPGNARELRSLIERTMLAAADGSTIEAEAVETVALRLTGKADFADPWANFSLKEEVQRFEEHLIEKALRDSEGKVSTAARLLGFKHHESLNWRLKNRNKNLLPARTPAKPRKRSIIKKYQPKRD